MTSKVDTYENQGFMNAGVGYGSISCGVCDGESIVETVLDALNQADLLSDNPGLVLNDVIDPDGLELLFSDRADETARQGGQVSFGYGGATVTVTPEAVTIYK